MVRMLVSFFVLGLSACSTEPQTSYCEALCDHAVTCAGDERPVDADALTSDCLAATSDLSDDCAAAENGELNAAEAKALTECTDALETETCDAITGTLDELKSGAPPAKCATQPGAVDAYEAARDSVTESNAELCTRFSDSFCNRTYDCILEDFGGNIDPDVIKAVGSEPVELCLDSVSDQTDTCTNDGLYAPEESLDDANLARQGARSCLTDLSNVACGDLLSGSIPKVCAASFASKDDALSFATALLDVATAFEKAAKK